MDSEHHKKKNSSQTALIAVMAIVIIALAGSTYYFYHKYKEASQARPNLAMMGGNNVPGGRRGMMGGGMMMKPMPTPTLTDQQNKELAAGTAKDTTEKTFDVDGGNFYFTPNKITVNKGDKVTIVFHNDGGFHNFMLDEFTVKTDTIQGGKTATVTFTADKTGTFQYYCSVGRHKQMGMVGTLVVQ